MLAIAFAGNAYAAPSPADLEAEGVEKSQSGDLKGALVLFHKAEALEPSASVLCNLGNVYYALNTKDSWPVAHFYLGRCLAETNPQGDAQYFVDISERYRTTEDDLRQGAFGAVSVQIDPADATLEVSTFPSHVILSGARVIWLPAGECTIVVRAKGFTSVTLPVVIRKGQTLTETVSLIALENKKSSDASAVASVRPSANQPTEPSALPTEPSANQPTTRRRFAIATAAAGLGAIVVGGYLGFEAKSKRDEQRAMQLPPGNEYEMLKRDGERLQITGNGLLLGGAALGLVSAYLFWTDSKSRAERVAVDVSGSSVALRSSWRF
jgi:hypothetical protein